MPTRTSQLSIEFSSLLSKAYGTYYGMPDIVKFSHGSFQWCKKLSFSDAESQRRQTFKIGDFMMERGRSNEVVRIDQIMVPVEIPSLGQDIAVYDSRTRQRQLQAISTTPRFSSGCQQSFLANYISSRSLR